ncbi:MAG: CBS domain-containing protein [Methanobacteriota archaeon]|nr:MAG: CBS domain-containing protein [Euryarchaeota archaeon]
MKLPTVSEAMTRGAISCEESCTIEEVAKLMVEKNIRSVVIQNKIGKPIGLATGGDIVKAMAKRLSPETKVSEIIGKELITVEADADIIDATEIMNKRNIKRLVVVDKGEVVGIITVKDVLKYSPKYLQEFAKTLDKLDTIIKKL